MERSRKVSWMCGLLAAAGLAALTPLQQKIDETAGGNRALDEALYVSSGNTIRRFSLGFDGVISDLYWIRTVQYFGRKLTGDRLDQDVDFSRLNKENLRNLAPLLKIVTEVDPKQFQAYRTGALFLAEFDYDAAIELLKSGIKNNPKPLEQARLWTDLGGIYWRAKRYEECSDAYAQGAQRAISEEDKLWMTSMAAAAKDRNGDSVTAYLIYERMLHEAEGDAARSTAEWKLQCLISRDERAFLTRMAKLYRERNNRAAPSFAQLFPLIVEHRAEAKDALGRPLPIATDPKRYAQDRTPLDPLGLPYRYLPEKDCVGLDPKSEIAADSQETCK
jgi:tetratricopeptide (TPR) repeat protein